LVAKASGTPSTVIAMPTEHHELDSAQKNCANHEIRRMVGGGVLDKKTSAPQLALSKTN
jgi:hypothetical protein